MSEPFKIAIAGLGTVGVGVLKVLEANGTRIARRCGRPIEVVAVSARNREKDRGVDLSAYTWFDDPVAMARESGADAIVELIGGSSGPAKAVAEAAFAAGVHVITANKAMIAVNGRALGEQAEAAGVALNFEAAVAGGVPIIKGVREALAANDITAVYGILNGTCNYILSTMRDTGRAFDDVLIEAQDLGYAEAEPSVDIDGIDAAHKLAILTSLCFGTPVDFDAVHVEGIRGLSDIDVGHAEELGYRVKLLGIARRTDAGIEQRVHPCLVDRHATLASVEGVFNAVVVEGDFVGRALFVGRGAGEGPTASAVVADVMDVAAGHVVPPFTVPGADLENLPQVPQGSYVGPFYVRLRVLDQPGVFADVAAVLKEQGVSMESIIQRGRDEAKPVDLVMTLHDTREEALERAIAALKDHPHVVEDPVVIRIVALDEAD